MESSSYSNSFPSSLEDNFASYSQQVQKKPKPPPAYRSSRHSVRKPARKLLKQPIAPLPPVPAKIYKVDPMDFREVVQRLTGQPPDQLRNRRLQKVAPPPLDLSTTAFSDRSSKVMVVPPQLLPSPEKSASPLSATIFRDFMSGTLEEYKPRRLSDYSFGELSPLGFGLSPATIAWRSSILFSPGTLSPYGQNTVL